ncbi:MAG: hypothetical protein HYV09_19010 [Deltaproteobacteria bacterium]|nr:hypothetical protein [Deltaproteobacteria bacterium]
MRYDGEERALRFASEEEAERFHRELTTLIRSVMVATTKRIEDAEQAKELSREVMQENATLFRALNALRTALTRHGS